MTLLQAEYAGVKVALLLSFNAWMRDHAWKRDPRVAAADRSVTRTWKLLDYVIDRWPSGPHASKVGGALP